ncbi:hypothetical protein GH714_007969 [Hevea brasiliensis]|uniref:Uncharacterized protein n=1 Tax=Hevea brasiliensis TaxID=3981 RepID=A0A6A6MBT1_HEVBR|nr:hypothetical protein GH714_007969 [Hevea brasiliensis]
MSHPTTTPSRFRVNSKAKDSPKPELANGSLSPANQARAKSVPPDVKKHSKMKRSLLLNKPKSGEDVIGSQKARDNEDVRVVARSVNRPVVEQFARPRRQRPVDSTATRNEQETKKELQERLELKEGLVKDLQSEVSALKVELDKAHSLNKELEWQKKKLALDLSAAEAKIAAFNTRDQESNGEYKSPKFKDIQKLIANKLEHSTAKKEAYNEPTALKTPVPPPPPPPVNLLPKAANAERKSPCCPSLPPPPPPLPMRPLVRAASAPKTSAIVEFYHSLRKQEEKRDIPGPGNQYKPAVTSAHSSIVGEIQNRSAHLLAIKADVQTKGNFINGLIQKVLAVAYTDIEDVLKFVDWLDDQACFYEAGEDVHEEVIMELELARNSDRESNQEALVLQGVHFAYRAHQVQFAGGLDSETLCAFEEIRRASSRTPRRISRAISCCSIIMTGR